ncbi:Glucosyl-3-phosphoglycerate phosphatase [Arthrobacter saudimassiliensis]|uniref:Glucosyl-3-phosphoglycerate phosphatase n=1 Tax=Arthrobacter saudimassiliensis TaxID=1461584 RepID=A0A078MU27_9MICC|nr:Glucosyl-3-phosphoglycerate phosphatase [Arthrobacter saudimassiliensis]
MASRSPWDPANTGRRVLFWRHGRTEWNRAGRFQGQLDIPLDAVGRAQAEAAARRLRLLRPAVIISSDLARARDTAAALGSAAGLDVDLDDRLRETMAGRWQGMSFADITADDGEALARWSAGASNARAGGGETRAEVGRRVADAVGEALQRVPAEGLLVVASHGGAIRAGICAMLELPEDSWAVIGGVSNAHWSLLDERDPAGGGPRWQLAHHNFGPEDLPVQAPAAPQET